MDEEEEGGPILVSLAGWDLPEIVYLETTDNWAILGW